MGTTNGCLHFWLLVWHQCGQCHQYGTAYERQHFKFRRIFIDVQRTRLMTLCKIYYYSSVCKIFHISIHWQPNQTSMALNHSDNVVCFVPEFIYRKLEFWKGFEAIDPQLSLLFGFWIHHIFVLFRKTDECSNKQTNKQCTVWNANNFAAKPFPLILYMNHERRCSSDLLHVTANAYIIPTLGLDVDFGLKTLRKIEASILRRWIDFYKNEKNCKNNGWCLEMFFHHKSDAKISNEVLRLADVDNNGASLQKACTHVKIPTK